MSLPLSPPVKPQLAKSARELPAGDDWCYEPKWDGFRTIVFRDGADVHLQSRNGRPMNRYFPDVVEQVLALPAQRLVLDGEMVVTVDGVQEFDLLSQRIHPAASRVERLRAETPAALVAFDLLAEDDELLPGQREHVRDDLREVPVHRLAIAALEVHVVAVAEGDGAEAVPLRLVAPVLALGQLLRGSRELGLNGRRQREG